MKTAREIYASLTKGHLAVMAALLVVLLLGVIYVGAAFGYRGDCVAAQAGIKAQQEQVKNNYDNLWKRIREMSQVPGMYEGTLKKVFDSAMQGRYGEDGSKAVFSFIQEHNPQVDASLFTKIQTAIESGRVSFMAEQQQLLDHKRQYEVVLQDNRALFVRRWFSFPTIDLDKITILTSDATEAAFATKRVDEIKLVP